jgi:hypothetical protein
MSVPQPIGELVILYGSAPKGEMQQLFVDWLKSV